MRVSGSLTCQWPVPYLYCALIWGIPLPPEYKG